MLAIYAIAMVIPNAIKNSVKAILDIVFPKICEYERKDVTNKLKKHILSVFSTSVVFVVILWFSLPYLIRIVYTNKYFDSIFYAQLLSLTLILFPSVVLLQQVLVAYKEERSIIYYNVLTRSSRTILFFVLIPLYGVIGVIYAMLIALTLQLSYISYLVFIKT